MTVPESDPDYFSKFKSFQHRVVLEVGDTLSDSIQCLNLQNDSIQYSIQYCLPTIQYYGDSVQRIIQFNSQGIINIGQIRKVPKKCPKYTEKGAFYQKSKI